MLPDAKSRANPGKPMAIFITETNAPAFHLTDAEALKIRPHGKGAATLTRGLCRAFGEDAANKQMREAGRSRWNEHDADLAAEITMRNMVFGGFLPPACYEQCIGEPFPYVMGNDGSWIKLRPNE